MNEIVNKVANSKLVTIDLEDYYPKGNRVLLDIKPWLFQELILKEQDFREVVSNYNWESLKDCYVALTCTADAIIPSWAYLLLTTYAAPFAKKIVVGDLQNLETSIFQEVIQKFDTTLAQNKPVIIKGCADKPIPPTAYTQLIEKILPHASSIMYGEACSTVPLFKKKRN
ncbi:DUF2480 family protein [Flavicella marina]|uniref:DUF2480 family protein n=1 Tax=Flavicella marina TaxID=1475951 RepID=UPI0012653622|nr:DUF2480 family protein [Flavicella marina]